jgi:hypothetical protein
VDPAHWPQVHKSGSQRGFGAWHAPPHLAGQKHAPLLHDPTPQELQLGPQQLLLSATHTLSGLFKWKLAGQVPWQLLVAGVAPAWHISVPPVGPAGQAPGQLRPVPLPPQQERVLLAAQAVLPEVWLKPLLQV